jgi:hypothetical protein
MKRTTSLWAVAILLSALYLVSLAPCAVHAQELLTNGNLNQVDEDGNPNPALYYNEPVAWDIVTSPCSYSPCAITPYVPGQLYTQYAGYIAGFADRLNPNVVNNSGLIGAAFEGHYPNEIIGPVSVELQQSVPGIAGQEYRFAGWAHFEAGYAGGVDFLALDSPNQRNQNAQTANPGVPVASLTDTIFALEFLDGGGNVLPNSIVWELRNDGGQQNDNQLDGRTWVQHVLKAVAPAGTANVRVRAGMLNGEFNIDPPGQAQSVFFDDFSLLAVPEPTSGLLALFGLSLVGAVRRKR